MSSTTTENGLRIWEQVQATDPAFTKSFTGHLGFQGTAVNPTYVFRKATEMFGPIGVGWGADTIHEEFVKGAPIGCTGDDGEKTVFSIVHKAKVELWYIDPVTKQKGIVRQFGGTKFMDRDQNGKIYCDDDAWKKSMTDGMVKCLTLIGISADIHLGLFDDSKYVQSLETFFAEQAANAGASISALTGHDAEATRHLMPAGQQQPARAESDGKHSARYLQWKERLLAGIDEKDLPRTREVISADGELNDLERALLLGSKELKAAGQASRENRSDRRGSRYAEPASNEHEFI